MSIRLDLDTLLVKLPWNLTPTLTRVFYAVMP
jgi:hypothetical protein